MTQGPGPPLRRSHHLHIHDILLCLHPSYLDQQQSAAPWQPISFLSIVQVLVLLQTSYPVVRVGPEQQQLTCHNCFFLPERFVFRVTVISSPPPAPTKVLDLPPCCRFFFGFAHARDLVAMCVQPSLVPAPLPRRAIHETNVAGGEAGERWNLVRSLYFTYGSHEDFMSMQSDTTQPRCFFVVQFLDFSASPAPKTALYAFKITMKVRNSTMLYDWCNNSSSPPPRPMLTLCFRVPTSSCSRCSLRQPTPRASRRGGWSLRAVLDLFALRRGETGKNANLDVRGDELPFRFHGVSVACHRCSRRFTRLAVWYEGIIGGSP
jgi:hypothetical protein